MTDKEKEKLLVTDFDKIWDDLWVNNTESRSYRNEYKFSLKRFENIKKGVINEKGLHIKLDDLIYNSTTQYNDLEWGFPKGRRNREETDLNCAIREFSEETNYQRNEYQIIEDIQPFDEEFIGTNSTAYRYVYYICHCKSKRDAEIDFNNKNQISEIGNLGWFDYQEAKELISDTCIRRVNVLTKLDTVLKNKYSLNKKGKVEEE
jgi:8-oxo-dGTP pyrophosphatase MutT (NUDIX family)